MGILRLHSVADLYGALRTEECATCSKIGLFLFLPTCRRCCMWCRKYHPSLRLMNHIQAQKYYSLTKEETDSLPIVHIRKAMVRGEGDVYQPIHGRAIIVQAARDLALAVHGSDDGVERVVLKRCRSVNAREIVWFWTKAHRIRPRYDWGVKLANYGTMTTMPFPTLAPDRTLEHARWCEGCQETSDSFRVWRRFHFTLIDAGIEESMRASIPPEYRAAEYHPSVVLFGLPDRA